MLAHYCLLTDNDVLLGYMKSFIHIQYMLVADPKYISAEKKKVLLISKSSSLFGCNFTTIRGEICRNFNEGEKLIGFHMNNVFYKLYTFLQLFHYETVCIVIKKNILSQHCRNKRDLEKVTWVHPEIILGSTPDAFQSHGIGWMTKAGKNMIKASISDHLFLH